MMAIIWRLISLRGQYSISCPICLTSTLTLLGPGNILRTYAVSFVCACSILPLRGETMACHTLSKRNKNIETEDLKFHWMLKHT